MLACLGPTVRSNNKRRGSILPAINKLTVSPSAIARLLAALALLLIISSVAGQLTKILTGHDYVYGLVPFFDLDQEHNLPTFFSALLLLFSAFLLAIITVLKHKDKLPFIVHWAFLSFWFMFMAADELLSFHEKLAPPMREILGGGTLGIFYFAWVIPGIVVVVVLGLFYLQFLWNLSANVRWIFLAAATLYLGGAIGFELIGGRFAEIIGQISIQRNLTYTMIVTVEEGLEMIGLIVFIYGLLKYLADNYDEVRFQFDNVEKKGGS